MSNILENVSLVSDYSRSETTKDAQAEVLGTDTKGNTVLEPKQEQVRVFSEPAFNKECFTHRVSNFCLII